MTARTICGCQLPNLAPAPRGPKLQSKGQCLERYAERDPVGLAQFDGFGPEWADDCMPADPDGDALMSTSTTELMRSPFAVRVLVQTDNRAQAARMLRKIAGWIERDPDALNRKPRVHPSHDDSDPFPF